MLKRWRTSKGFGVHSPFAYTLITEVLRLDDRYGWYAYDEIDAVTTHGPTRRRARLIYRIARRFSDRRLAVVGRFTEADVAAFDLAVPRHPLTADVAKAEVAIITDRATARAARKAMSCGMSFSSRSIAVLVLDPALPLTHYKLYM